MVARRVRQPADRDRAEAQVHAEIARALHGGVVAGGVVVLDPLQEVCEQGFGRRGAAMDLELLQIGLHEPERRQAGLRLARAGRRRGERSRMAFDRVRLEEEVVDLFQPGVLVRREHAVGLAAAGEHLAALEDHVVFRRVERDAEIGELAAHMGVAGQGVRVVVVVGEHGLHVQFVRECHDLVGGLAVAHEQARAGPPVGLTEGGQRRVEVVRALHEELDAAIGARQNIEDLGVEHECAPDLARRTQGVMERCVVVRAQVTAEPHQGGVEGFFGGAHRR